MCCCQAELGSNLLVLPSQAEFEDDDEVEAFYFSAAAGRARITLGNRRFGEGGFMAAGRQQARPVAPARSGQGKVRNPKVSLGCFACFGERCSPSLCTRLGAASSGSVHADYCLAEARTSALLMQEVASPLQALRRLLYLNSEGCSPVP